MLKANKKDHVPHQVDQQLISKTDAGRYGEIPVKPRHRVCHTRLKAHWDNTALVSHCGGKIPRTNEPLPSSAQPKQVAKEALWVLYLWKSEHISEDFDLLPIALRILAVWNSWWILGVTVQKMLKLHAWWRHSPQTFLCTDNISPFLAKQNSFVFQLLLCAWTATFCAV